MTAGGGLLTKDALAGYGARVSPPLTGRYRDLDLALAPGATGGITALEILNILDDFAPHAVGWQTTGGLHVRAEASRRAFCDRFAHLGDPAVVKAPWGELASKAYAQAVAADLRKRGAGGGGTPAVSPQRKRPSGGRAGPGRAAGPPPRGRARPRRGGGGGGGPAGRPPGGEGAGGGGGGGGAAAGKAEEGPRRSRLHDAHRRHRPGPQHGLADSHGRVALWFAGGRHGHRDL